MSGLLPFLKLIVASGAVSPKAPTFRERFGKPKKPKGRDATGDTPAFGKLGFKKFF